jgi:signal transduction histidine kinase
MLGPAQPSIPLVPQYPSSEVDRLAEQLARLESLFEAVPLAIAVFNDALTLVRANTRYCELTQLPHGQSSARSIYDAFPNALADLSDEIDAVLGGAQSGRPMRIAFQHQRGPRVVEATFTALGGEDEAGGVLFVASDITELETLRTDLARNVAQLEAIFDVMPESVRVFDAQGTVVRFNTQAQRDGGTPPAGASRPAAQPRTLRDLWRRDLPRTLDGMSLFVHEHPTARALRGESVRGETLVVRRAAQGDTAEAVIEVNANPLRDASGVVRGAVTIERDVTERTRLASELAEQVRRSAELYALVSTEAERLERMVAERTQELLKLQESRARERQLAAIGQLAAGVMHDVNNALNPIMAAAHLLTLRADDPAAVRDYAARILKAAETGAATAARVGRFIRQEPMAGRPEQCVDLATLADEVIAMTRPLWAERARGGPVHLNRSLSDGVLVRGIAGEIREALLNLVQNALDAMPGGGTLSMCVRAADDAAVIEIGDSGSGMTPEVREHAFEPFFTTKGVSGTGLGLAEVYGIMRRHRGRAEIDSAPGAGTTLRLVFPRTEAPDEPAELAHPARRSAKRVLVVEDNDDGREFLCALLTTDGHTVDAVGTVRDATARLASGSPAGVDADSAIGPALPYDVLITDVGLPDGCGWDLVTAARARWPRLRIGVVTGWEPRGDAAAEADFSLRKPVAPRDLLRLVAIDADARDERQTCSPSP